MLEISVYIRPDDLGRFTQDDRKLLATLVDFMPDGGKPSIYTAGDPEPVKDSPVAKAEEPEEKPAPKPRRSTAKKSAPAKSEDEVTEEDVKLKAEPKAEPEPEEVTTEPEEDDTPMALEDDSMALEDDSKAVTLEDAVQAATSVAKAQGKDVVVAALKAVGAKRVTEIEPSKLGDFITALEV